MTSLLWLPIILSSVCLFFIYLFKLAVGTRNSIGKRIVVSKQLKSAILYLIGLVLIYSMFYSVANMFLLLENTLEGNTIIQPELKNVEVNEGKAQTLLNIMLMSYTILSTFFAGGFIKSVIKASVGIMRNRNSNIRKVE